MFLRMFVQEFSVLTYFYNELNIKDRCVEKIIENNSKADYRYSRDIFIFFTLFIL
jgi:hypothetical protein